MSDFADEASGLELLERTVVIAAVRYASAAAPNDDPDCRDCGSEIPDDRRRAHPGATRCISCQEARERTGRLFSGVPRV